MEYFSNNTSSLSQHVCTSSYVQVLERYGRCMCAVCTIKISRIFFFSIVRYVNFPSLILFEICFVHGIIWYNRLYVVCLYTMSKIRGLCPSLTTMSLLSAFCVQAEPAVNGPFNIKCEILWSTDSSIMFIITVLSVSFLLAVSILLELLLLLPPAAGI